VRFPCPARNGGGLPAIIPFLSFLTNYEKDYRILWFFNNFTTIKNRIYALHTILGANGTIANELVPVLQLNMNRSASYPEIQNHWKVLKR
jgi:hypothetical protein